MLIFVCLVDDLILGFCDNNLRQESSELELALTITLVLQANRLTKCASHPKQVFPSLGKKQCFSFLKSITTGSPQVVNSSWHRISSWGNQTSTSLINTILCIAHPNTCSPALLQELASNSAMLWTKPMSSAFTPNTFTIGHWLWLASVFNNAMSPFWNFLHLLFHIGQVWRIYRNFWLHLTQNSFAMCWICLHLLLHSSALTNWPVGGNTTLDIFARILLGHSGCLLWTSPKLWTVSSLEFNIASVSASGLLIDSTFNDLPCVFKRENRMVPADQIYLSQTPLMWLDAVGFLYQTV